MTLELIDFHMQFLLTYLLSALAICCAIAMVVMFE